MCCPRPLAAIVLAVYAVSSADTTSLMTPMLSRPPETFRVIPDMYQDPFGMAATDMGEEEVARFSDLMYESPAHIQKCRDHDDDEPRPEEDWRLRKGESLQQCSQRLLKDLKYSNTDRFNFIFYELFFPSFMEKKRMKAYHLGKPLNAHYEREFAECERMEIPYSRELRAFLGEHKSIKSYMEARKVKSPLHNPDKSLQHRFWYACQTGAEDEEIFSLADKVDINARDATYFNFSGLDFAIERNHSAVAEVLLALDIDHDSLNGFNLTAFDFAFFAENLRVMDAITWTSMLKKRRFEFESGLESIMNDRRGSDKYKLSRHFGLPNSNAHGVNEMLPYLIPE